MNKIYTIILSFFSLIVVSQNEQLAQNYIDKGEFDKAASLYEELDKKQPNNFYFCQKLVSCYQGLKQFDKAEKLLLNKKELKKLDKDSDNKGLTIVPLKLYTNEKGFAKVEIALCRGKKNYDKRETMKENDTKRDIARIKKEFR